MRRATPQGQLLRPVGAVRLPGGSVPGQPSTKEGPALTASGALVVIFMVDLVVVGTALATEAWQALGGPELHQIIAESELTDGVHYAYQLNADGTLTGFNMGKPVSGKWRITADMLCWTWVRPTLAEECFAVERNSGNFRFVRDGTEIFTGTLSRTKTRVPTRGVSQ